MDKQGFAPIFQAGRLVLFSFAIGVLSASQPARLLAQDDSPVAAISALKMNVLYLGVDNPLKIAVTETKANDMDVTISNGVLTGSAGRYTARPEKEGTAIIRINIHGQVIASCEFRVKLIPCPQARFAGSRSGVILKETVLKTQKLEAVVENFDFNAVFKVTEFSMKVISKPPVEKEVKGKKIPIPDILTETFSNTDLLTAEQKTLLQGVSPGTRLLFENIKASCPDGNIRDLAPIDLLVQ